MANYLQKASRLSIRMTLFLLILVNSKNVIVQLFTIMPRDIPVFKEEFQKLDKLLSFAGVDVNDQIYIFFHVSADISQTPYPIKYPILIGGNSIFD